MSQLKQRRPGRPRKGDEVPRDWSRPQRMYLSLDGDLSKALHQITGRWMNALINQAVREYLARHYPGVVVEEECRIGEK